MDARGFGKAIQRADVHLLSEGALPGHAAGARDFGSQFGCLKTGEPENPQNAGFPVDRWLLFQRTQGPKASHKEISRWERSHDLQQSRVATCTWARAHVDKWDAVRTLRQCHWGFMVTFSFFPLDLRQLLLLS